MPEFHYLGSSATDARVSIHGFVRQGEPIGAVENPDATNLTEIMLAECVFSVIVIVRSIANSLN